MKKPIAYILVLLTLGLVAFLGRGLNPPTPNPPGTFSFGVLGDAPYNALEEAQLRLVRQDLDAHDLTMVISVGDIFWRPCSDEMYVRARNQFNALRHPVVYTPGDNEWFDCWEAGSGGYESQERLGRLRHIFYTTPAQSLGGRKIALLSQSEFIENVRWADHAFVFATVHLIGSGNGRWLFPNRTEDDVAASRKRTEAAASWLRETFDAAKAANAPAVVIAMHGAPFDEEPKDREVFEPFLTTLREEAARSSARCSSRTATIISTKSTNHLASQISHGSRCQAHRMSDGCESQLRRTPASRSRSSRTSSRGGSTGEELNWLVGCASARRTSSR